MGISAKCLEKYRAEFRIPDEENEAFSVEQLNKGYWL